MAVNEFTGAASNKVSAVGNWSLGHKPTAAEDAVFQEGKTPEFNAVMVCRSLLVRKNVKVTGVATPEIGNSEKPEGPAGAGVIFAQESGVTWPSSLIVKLISTYTASELPIKLGPSWFGKESGTLQLLGSAKYGLAEETDIDSNLALGGGTSSPTLITNGHEAVIATKASLPSFSGGVTFNGGTITLSLGASVIKLGEWYSDSGTVTVNPGTSTIVIADGVRGFFEGVKTYYSLSFEGGRPQLRSNFTLEGALAFNRTNGFAGIGFTLFAKPLGGSEENESIGNGKYTVTLKKGASITTNGTAEHPAEVVGTSEGERSQLVLEEDIEVKGVLNWKYVEALNHKIYAPEATNITGCVNIVKEAKGGESFSGTATLRGASHLTATGAKTGEGSATLRGAGRPVATGQKVTEGVGLLRAAPRETTLGAKAAAGSASVRAGTRVGASGQKGASAAAVLRAAARNVTAGAKAVVGEGLLRSAATLLSAGTKASGGSVVLRGAARVLGQGRKSGIGTALLRAAARLLGGSAPPPEEELPVLFAGGSSAPTIAAGGMSEAVIYGSGHSAPVLDAEGGAQ